MSKWRSAGIITMVCVCGAAFADERRAQIDHPMRSSGRAPTVSQSGDRLAGCRETNQHLSKSSI